MVDESHDGLVHPSQSCYGAIEIKVARLWDRESFPADSARPVDFSETDLGASLNLVGAFLNFWSSAELIRGDSFALIPLPILHLLCGDDFGKTMGAGEWLWDSMARILLPTGALSKMSQSTHYEAGWNIGINPFPVFLLSSLNLQTLTSLDDS
jgi:hypothetical protein